jgi:hypothetical protein
MKIPMSACLPVAAGCSKAAAPLRPLTFIPLCAHFRQIALCRRFFKVGIDQTAYSNGIGQ